MKHLIVSREYPPASYPPGGIGTYAAHIARLLAEAGDTVHVVGERWEGANQALEELCDGRLIVHRIAADDAHFYPSLNEAAEVRSREVEGMLASGYPQQWFSWCTAGLAERLVEEEGIDVIEGQEWDAPLYYFMLRRALGFGPKRTPPCIVHLHSPTEFIYFHDEYSLLQADYLPRKRFEEYGIGAADAFLCPSRFLADQCAKRYGLNPDSIEVIPLPQGDTALLHRPDRVWAEGSILYLGRLEPRKGVIEWVDAAVTVAREDPRPTFEFVGTDIGYTEWVTVGQHVEQRIPEDLRSRFLFHGARPRQEALAMLAGARIAVVPSRWENFPNTCIEAMSSGLPVLASCHGGMATMIEDGRTGWLCTDGAAPLADRLTEALRRAVATPPATLAAMGRDASASIRQLCDNSKIVRRHMEFRQRVAGQGSTRSLALPAHLPWPDQPVRPRPLRRASETSPRDGIAVVLLTTAKRPCDQTLASLAAQTVVPASVVVVSIQAPAQRRSLGSGLSRAILLVRRGLGLARSQHRPAGNGLVTQPVNYPGSSTAVAKALGVDKALSEGVEPLGWLFLAAGDTLAPNALAIHEAVLRRCPEVGVVGTWLADPEKPWSGELASTPPAFPYQWLANELEEPVVFRAEAVREVGGPRTDLDSGLETWDLANAVMAAGWAAVRIPAILGHREGGLDGVEDAMPLARKRSRRRLLDRHPELVGRDATSLIALLEAKVTDGYGRSSGQHSAEPVAAPATLGRSLRPMLHLAKMATRQPGAAGRRLVWQSKAIARARLARLRNTPPDGAA